MKLHVHYYDNILYRPFYKFNLNLFFLKNNSYFLLKQLTYIHIFMNIKKILNIKIFKFTYNFYQNFIIYFLISNLFFQIYLIFIIL